ncbi:pancreatic triacylglycerol lipase-like [Elysia marginata]|uniref:Pancreatic triacylglycerol lipase-like n=1 Tax=Elysia marginata TaxID=1093978 RepID=A0AAV4J892_9GAST|nr:pancreatic triacylglycerol lipase-like [Elysia marginata]
MILQGDYNVIIVSWSKGARLTNYDLASANVRLVATQVKVLLKLLQRVAGLQMKDVHMIGHSLGAHTSGYVGTLMGDKIARITGLDPADPNFEHLPYVVRLDPTDALFVDVIHTDGRKFESTVGFGLAQPSGHIDFYVNGGKNQKGCTDGIQGLIDGVIKSVRGKSDLSLAQTAGKGAACSHARAHSIFVESINSKCKFKSFPCENYDKFLRGECYQCGLSGCSTAGFYADDYPTATGKHYLMTYAKEPYCGDAYYNLHIKVLGSQRSTKGDIYVQLRNMKGIRTRKVSLMGRDDKKMGRDGINMPIVLDKSLQQLGKDGLFIELTYKKMSAPWYDFWTAAQKTFRIQSVKLTEVATGQSMVSSGTQTRELHDKVGNVITLKREVFTGITG